MAKVHSVYQHALNLIVDDGALITLASPGIAIMPMGIIVDNVLDLGWSVKVGDLVTLGQEELLRCKSIAFVDIDDAQVWDPAPILEGAIISEQTLIQMRSELVGWLTDQPNMGLLPLLKSLTAHSCDSDDEASDAYSRYIAKDLLQFVNEMHSLEWQRALNTARNLIGFGMGSTPSCDDFLVAYLVVFAIGQTLEPVRFAWVSEFNQGIVALAKTRTTTISASMLEHAATGKVSQSHQRLIHGCLFETDCDLVELMNEVGQTGASSGMDFLLGLSCSLEWFIDTVILHPAKGGMEQVGAKQLQPVTIV
ncbi:MAG: DUF2877 domain-containing protein [Anaerolineaceae bacterium]